MKKYKLSFCYRRDDKLKDTVETIEAKSLTAAKLYGRQIAQQRGWRFVEAYPATP